MSWAFRGWQQLELLVVGAWASKPAQLHNRYSSFICKPLAACRTDTCFRRQAAHVRARLVLTRGPAARGSAVCSKYQRACAELAGQRQHVAPVIAWCTQRCRWDLREGGAQLQDG